MSETHSGYLCVHLKWCRYIGPVETRFGTSPALNGCRTHNVQSVYKIDFVFFIQCYVDDDDFITEYEL